jgi:hypothetical protein
MKKFFILFRTSALQSQPVLGEKNPNLFQMSGKIKKNL